MLYYSMICWNCQGGVFSKICDLLIEKAFRVIEREPMSAKIAGKLADKREEREGKAG
jgi:hypothetical protein